MAPVAAAAAIEATRFALQKPMKNRQDA